MSRPDYGFVQVKWRPGTYWVNDRHGKYLATIEKVGHRNWQISTDSSAGRRIQIGSGAYTRRDALEAFTEWMREEEPYAPR